MIKLADLLPDEPHWQCLAPKNRFPAHRTLAANMQLRQLELCAAMCLHALEGASLDLPVVSNCTKVIFGFRVPHGKSGGLGRN